MCPHIVRRSTALQKFEGCPCGSRVKQTPEEPSVNCLSDEIDGERRKYDVDWLDCRIGSSPSPGLAVNPANGCDRQGSTDSEFKPKITDKAWCCTRGDFPTYDVSN